MEVPQGSVLVPTLFILYINDLCSALQVLTPILYADDTKLFYESNDLDGDADIMNIVFNLLNDWCVENKLTINFTKTNYIVLKHSQNRFKFTGKLYFYKSILKTVSHCWELL